MSSYEMIPETRTNQLLESLKASISRKEIILRLVKEMSYEFEESVLDILETPERIIECGDLILNTRTLKCSWKGKSVDLTYTEFTLLELLANKPEVIYSRNQIMDYINPNRMIYDRSIDSHIKRVRINFKKMDPDFDNIVTVYGVGYKWKE